MDKITEYSKKIREKEYGKIFAGAGMIFVNKYLRKAKKIPEQH